MQTLQHLKSWCRHASDQGPHTRLLIVCSLYSSRMLGSSACWSTPCAECSSSSSILLHGARTAPLLAAVCSLLVPGQLIQHHDVLQRGLYCMAWSCIWPGVVLQQYRCWSPARVQCTVCSQCKEGSSSKRLEYAACHTCAAVGCLNTWHGLAVCVSQTVSCQRSC